MAISASASGIISVQPAQPARPSHPSSHSSIPHHNLAPPFAPFRRSSSVTPFSGFSPATISPSSSYLGYCLLPSYLFSSHLVVFFRTRQTHRILRHEPSTRLQMAGSVAGHLGAGRLPIQTAAISWINDQMQRSRKALLRRRAAGKKSITMGKEQLYKVSLSLVIFSWLIVFLLNSLISHGNDYRDVDELAKSIGELPLQEVAVCLDKDLGSESALISPDMVSDISLKTFIAEDEVPVGEEVMTDGCMKQDTERKQGAETASDVDIKLDKEASVKAERLSRIASPGLDEFKSKSISSKEKLVSNQANTVVHKMESGGKEYNYASSSKGAKVLEFNKEAKGAANILDKDKDKYLRNPCSAEEKYVVIELSEETLVDTIEIANFEHYSSNFKDFELYSSLVYPADNWVKLGNFTAANVKHKQTFSLPDPNWASYLRLNLLSHFGSEFFCTLSLLEVYGVDAVEKMLENLISVETKPLEFEELGHENILLAEHAHTEGSVNEPAMETDNEPRNDNIKLKRESLKNMDPVLEAKTWHVGRVPGDTALKVLMQKVHSLDLSFSVMEKYLEELSSRYGRIFKDFDNDISEKELLLEKIMLEIKNLRSSKDDIENEVKELLLWRSTFISQVDLLLKDSAMLRSEVERIRDRQAGLENKGFAVIFVSFIFGSLAVTKLFIDAAVSICRLRRSDNCHQISSAWLMLLLSSTIIGFILAI